MTASDNNDVKISVVIPHLNQPVFLERCLKSLMRGTRIPDEIIVVDNGSAQLPHEICTAFDRVRVLSEPTPGPGPARNHGVTHSRFDVVAFIDTDCLAHADWLAVAEDEMRDPQAQVLGGDVHIALNDPARLTQIEAYESIYGYRVDRYIKREGFTVTCNMVVRRSVLRAVGGFAGLDLAEDRDWGRRATAQGYVIRHVPDMKVYHPARQQFAQLQQKWDRHMAHDFVEARGRRGGRLKWLLKAVAMLGSPLVEVPHILVSPRLDGARNRLLGFVGLTRIRVYRAVRMMQLLFGLSPDVLLSRWNRG